MHFIYHQARMRVKTQNSINILLHWTKYPIPSSVVLHCKNNMKKKYNKIISEQINDKPYFSLLNRGVWTHNGIMIESL